MSTFKPLKILASRRQVLKAGLAAMTLSGVASQVSAKEQPLKTSNGHSKPAAKKAAVKKAVAKTTTKKTTTKKTTKKAETTEE